MKKQKHDYKIPNKNGTSSNIKPEKLLPACVFLLPFYSAIMPINVLHWLINTVGATPTWKGKVNWSVHHGDLCSSKLTSIKMKEKESFCCCERYTESFVSAKHSKWRSSLILNPLACTGRITPKPTQPLVWFCHTAIVCPNIALMTPLSSMDKPSLAVFHLFPFSSWPVLPPHLISTLLHLFSLSSYRFDMRQCSGLTPTWW